MNQALLGVTITSLRKERHMTQGMLAEALNISYKTISRWETGLGYPEISILPRLASVLGVTVDYLLSGERNGIAVVGNLHMDTVRKVDKDYRTELLLNTTSSTQDIGGCVPNITLNLSKIDPSIPLSAIGYVGNDENGRRILSRLQRYYIQTRNIISTNTSTGTNDIIIAPNSDRVLIRTHGANALFDPLSIEISSLTCRMIHFERLFFESYWKHDAEYGCRLARALRDLQSAGITTSISLNHSFFSVPPEAFCSVLKYCDYLFIGEKNLARIASHSMPAGKSYSVQDMMQHMLKLGVKKKVLLFTDSFSGACLDNSGLFTEVQSPEIYEDEVASINGINDDLCAGCLYGIYNNYPDKKLLEFALATIAAGLMYKKASDDMLPKKDLLHFMDQLKKRTQ